MSERLTMSHESVGQLLDDDLTIRVSEEKGTNREHLLFFSARDQQCFVAIRDAVTMTVVTVLPVDYYENLGCKIHWSQLEFAREIATRRPPLGTPQDACSSVLTENAAAPQPEPVYRVSAIVYTESCRAKTVNLGSWPASPGSNPERVVADPRFAATICERLDAKGMLDNAQVIVLQRRRDGTLMSFQADAILEHAAAA
ncbi:MAG: hypothetical protein ABI992_05450 [Chthoniobacterales bacterium]